ncbi:MAG: M4 family metallopeptidase [Desulfobacteraceae bacterium]|jgi:bacillolysin
MNLRLRIHTTLLAVYVCLCLPLLLSVGIFLNAASASTAFVVDPALSSRMKLQNGEALDTTSRPAVNRPLKSMARETTARVVGPTQDRLSAIQTKMEPDGGPQNQVSAAQRQNLMRLIDTAVDPQAVRAVFDPKNGTPTLLKVKAFAKSDRRGLKSSESPSAEAVARQFLRTHSRLLKLNDPDGELTLADAWSDAQGGSHYRYQQMINNIPIYGKQLLVHVDGSDSVYLANGRFEPTPQSLSTDPAIEPSDALEAVRTHLGLPDLAAEATELVVFRKPDGGMVLAYEVSVAPSLSEGWTYFIDAANADVVHRMSRIHMEIANASGVDLNGVNQSFNAWHQGGDYYLIDPGMPETNYPDKDYVSEIQSPGHTYVITANNGDGSSLYHITSGSTNSGWDAAGVSLMAHITTTHNYYKNTFGRNGLDDKNHNYNAVVHLGQNYANAFWNGTYIVFGDGDNQTFSNLAASLDVTAHELQHGITSFTANLKYENQSGALNEAYSDVFACMVDDKNWTVGEDCTIADPGHLRNLADPKDGLRSLPSTMSEYENLPNTEAGDWGGVHINMSIPSRAGYLMAEGLPSGAIGRAKTAEIWYRALTTYLTPYSQFSDGRNAMVQSAEDLYGAGSAEVAAVEAAWDTVEVYGSGDTPPPTPTPTPGDPVSGDDVMLYLWPTDNTHNPDTGDEHYNLCALLNPGSGYSEDNDICPLNDTTAYANYPRYTKTAAYTNSNGKTVIFYATENYQLHAVNLYADGTRDPSQVVIDTGEFFSIALSPDGRYFAYTTPDANDNHIYVLDLVENRMGTFAIEPFSDSDGGMEYFNTILHADSLAFDFTSKTLAFDALNCISTENSSCADGEGYRYWSIGFLHLADDPVDDQAIQASLSFPIPNQSPQFNIGYPAFAANNSYMLAVDVLDYTAYSTDSSIESMVLTLNGNTGESHLVVSPDRSGDGIGICGVPTFWGDDDAITIQWHDGANGSVDRVPIDANFAGPADNGYIDDGRVISSLNDYPAAMPMMHRMAFRSVSGALSLSAQSLSFDNTAVGTRATQTLTLINSGDRDIRILDINLNRGTGQFRHNGANGLLPRNGQMTIEVTFSPTAEGLVSDSLSITSDADVPTNLISLTGNTSSSSSDGDDAGDDGNDDVDDGYAGGSCMIGLLYSEMAEH